MALKQRVAGFVSLCSAVGMVYSIYRMIPYGIGGQVDKAKLWFILMIISLLVGLPFAVAFYYFRSRMHAGGNLDRLHIEVSTLAQLGQPAKKPVQAPRHTSHDDTTSV